jgi:enoyl-CoA hydratase
LTGADRIPACDALRMGLINRVVPVVELESAAIKLARHISGIDPMLVKRTKRAIDRTFEIMGMLEALKSALDIDLTIEGEGSSDKRQFMEIARRDGLKAAFARRDARFP